MTDLKPLPTEVVDPSDGKVEIGTPLVELILPEYLLRGKDARVALKIIGASAEPPSVYLARFEPADLVTPDGEVIEVAGDDGNAVFYWRFNEIAYDVKGRVWLYTLNGNPDDQQMVLLYALPVEIETKPLAWGWYLLAHLTLVIGSLIGGYRAKP